MCFCVFSWFFEENLNHIARPGVCDVKHNCNVFFSFFLLFFFSRLLLNCLLVFFSSIFLHWVWIKVDFHDYQFFFSDRSFGTQIVNSLLSHSLLICVTMMWIQFDQFHHRISAINNGALSFFAFFFFFLSVCRRHPKLCAMAACHFLNLRHLIFIHYYIKLIWFFIWWWWWFAAYTFHS